MAAFINSVFAQNTPLAIDFKTEIINNTDYRRIIYTGKMQIDEMCLKPKQEIGLEIHNEHDQAIIIIEGTGVGQIGELKFKVQNGSLLMVPAGYKHNVTNTG